MDAAQIHEAEQAAITAACESGTCDHPYCGMNAADIAQHFMDGGGALDDNRQRAARAYLAFAPAYDDTPKDALSDLLADILHLCDLAGWDFAEIEGRARRNYQVEVAELGTTQDAGFSRAIQEA